MHLSKSIECTAPRVNPNVNHGLRVVMMCPCRRGIQELSALPAQFCCEPETSVKKMKSIKKKSLR